MDSDFIGSDLAVVDGWLLDIFEKFVWANVAADYLEKTGKQVGKKLFQLSII